MDITSKLQSEIDLLRLIRIQLAEEFGGRSKIVTIKMVDDMLERMMNERIKRNKT